MGGQYRKITDVLNIKNFIQTPAKLNGIQQKVQGQFSQIKGQTVLCETGRQVCIRWAKRKGAIWI